jgi:hypothetical protein
MKPPDRNQHVHVNKNPLRGEYLIFVFAFNDDGILNNAILPCYDPLLKIRNVNVLYMLTNTRAKCKVGDNIRRRKRIAHPTE